MFSKKRRQEQEAAAKAEATIKARFNSTCECGNKINTGDFITKAQLTDGTNTWMSWVCSSCANAAEVDW